MGINIMHISFEQLVRVDATTDCFSVGTEANMSVINL